jgi:L-sorbose 1-phosphate reductase
MTIGADMEALVLSGQGFENLALKRIPVPHPGPDQFLARVDAVFACSSDSKLIANGRHHPLLYGWNVERWPITIGHEGCITAVQIGENLRDRIRPGDAFAVQPAINAAPINHRERYVDVGKVDKVAVGYTLGGMFSEYLLVTEEVIQAGCLFPYDPARVPYFAAAFSEPLSCVYSALTRIPHIYKDGPLAPRRVRLGTRRNGVILVLGAGSMGILLADMALTFNPRIIIISEPLEERRRNAEAILAPKCRKRDVGFILTVPNELAGVVRETTQGRGVDDCLAALGLAAVQEKSLDFLAKGGVVHFFGGTPPGESHIRIDTRRVHYDEISLVGSSGGDPSDVQEVMKLLKKKQISPEGYIRRVGGLNAARDLILSVGAQEFFGKGLIYPGLRRPLKAVATWKAADERSYLEGRGQEII